MDMGVYDVIVLAGGAGRRLGGVDKPAVRVGGVALLDRVLEVCRGARRTVVVGPRRPTVRDVEWTREEPAGGGPLPAIAAGLRRTTAEQVLVLAADLPFVTLRALRALFDGLHAKGEAAILVDAEGRDQPLLAAYRSAALRRELDVLVAEHGSLGGLPLRLLTAGLEPVRVPDPDGQAAFDCDTPEALWAARVRIREHGRVMDEWIAAAKADLGIDLEIDNALLLDLAGEVAHGVARPAAPLTTFLVGYAAGRAGGGAEAVADAAAKVSELVARWAAEAAEQAGGSDSGAAGSGGGSASRASAS